VKITQALEAGELTQKRMPEFLSDFTAVVDKRSAMHIQRHDMVNHCCSGDLGVGVYSPWDDKHVGAKAEQQALWKSSDCHRQEEADEQWYSDMRLQDLGNLNHHYSPVPAQVKLSPVEHCLAYGHQYAIPSTDVPGFCFLVSLVDMTCPPGRSFMNA
jgi:hypothetical protein